MATPNPHYLNALRLVIAAIDQDQETLGYLPLCVDQLRLIGALAGLVMAFGAETDGDGLRERLAQMAAAEAEALICADLPAD